MLCIEVIFMSICFGYIKLKLDSGLLSSSNYVICIFMMLCTYPVIPSFVHVCIYFWFPLWLFLELDSLLWNIVLEVSGPFYNLITRNYAINFNMNFLEVSMLLYRERLFTFGVH